MSRFLSSKFGSLVPYTPGEQPQKIKYLKLNTNELPFPPSPKAKKYAAENTRELNLYSDPECKDLVARIAEIYNVDSSEVVMCNGSDEILDFSFMAFCDKEHPVIFPNITYGFYPVFAELNGIPYEEIPLREDFTIDIKDYLGKKKNICIANPNAPTGICLPVSDIEKIVSSNPDNIVIIDEAYIDFGGESCIPLIKKYDNLIVTQTFSKSRGMAGARLGYAIGNKELIKDLNTIRYSTNPYNINSMSAAMALGVLSDEEYRKRNCAEIAENRDYTTRKLRKLGFIVLDSKTNFIFAKTDRMDGQRLYEVLKENGVLVRHFTRPEISQYNRITIGTREMMDSFLEILKKVLEE